MAIIPKVFISYTWESKINPLHKKWVKDFATQLRQDEIDVMLDQWDAIPGDRLPHFMEKAIRENDYVLMICTPIYKNKVDNREGASGYEGDVFTSELLIKKNERKFIPLLRRGSWEESAPSCLASKYYIDLSNNPYSLEAYDDLISTLKGTRLGAPPLGRNDT